MKVLLVAASSVTSGGGEKHVLDLVERLPARGVEPVLACPSGGDLPARAVAAGVTVERLEIAASFRPGQFLTLARILSEHRPDVVHAHGSRAAFFARLADRRAGSRCVYTLHGIHADRAGSVARRAASLGCERLLRHRTARFIAVCASDVSKGEALGVLSIGSTSVVHNGIEMPAAADGAAFRADVAEVLGSSWDGPLMLSIGRLHRQKDHGTLLRAWKLAVGAFPEARLALVGDGPLRDEVLSMRSREGLESSVALLPPRRDIASAYAAADSLVLSSLWEGLPYVVLEAMAHGLPVVATAVDGVPEAVADGRTGLLVPAGDSPALANALEIVLADADLRASMGAAGRERVADEFALDPMVDGVLRVYRMVAGRAPG